MSTGDRDEQMWNRVIALHAQVEQRLTAVLQRTHGLGLSEYRALGFLDAAPDDELRMQELANLLGLNQSSVTRLVGRLDAAGFAHRDLCPDDRRGVYTVITPAGRERYLAARDSYRATLGSALDDAPEGPALRKALG